VSENNQERRGPTRREVLVLGVGALAVAAVPLVGRRRVVRRTVPVMGTLAEIAVFHDDRAAAQAAIDAAIDELRQVDRWMTRFDAASDVGRANLGAAHDAVVISPATAGVVASAIGWAEASDGWFDPCLFRAIEVWDVGNREAPPPAAAFGRLAGRRLYRHLDLDTLRGQPAVRFGDTDVGLDLGGIAKGYGVDRAVAALRARGMRDAIVNVGGDLYAMGTGEDGDAWHVGVRSPHRPDDLVTTLPVRDQAVATSGSYLQYFESRGRRYHHLLDPETATPRACEMQSLTISAQNCVTADAAGTALFGRDPADATRVLAAHAPDAAVVLAI
jgi:thiamine biosynthesis lipoprotein